MHLEHLNEKQEREVEKEKSVPLPFVKCGAKMCCGKVLGQAFRKKEHLHIEKGTCIRYDFTSHYIMTAPWI